MKNRCTICCVYFCQTINYELGICSGWSNVFEALLNFPKAGVGGGFLKNGIGAKSRVFWWECGVMLYVESGATYQSANILTTTRLIGTPLSGKLYRFPAQRKLRRSPPHNNQINRHNSTQTTIHPTLSHVEKFLAMGAPLVFPPKMPAGLRISLELNYIPVYIVLHKPQVQLKKGNSDIYGFISEACAGQ